MFQGYDTVPNEDQIQLTDSQKLRIATARAIIREPAIVVIDELEQEDQVSLSVSRSAGWSVNHVGQWVSESVSQLVRQSVRRKFIDVVIHAMQWFI